MSAVLLSSWFDSLPLTWILQTPDSGDVPHINSVSRPFDWTFSTDYQGTLLGHQKLAPQPTDDRIDMEKLKQKEKIMFYEDILLFEDELADHGCAICNVKVVS